VKIHVLARQIGEDRGLNMESQEPVLASACELASSTVVISACVANVRKKYLQVHRFARRIWTRDSPERRVIDDSFEQTGLGAGGLPDSNPRGGKTRSNGVFPLVPVTANELRRSRDAPGIRDS